MECLACGSSQLESRDFKKQVSNVVASVNSFKRVNCSIHAIRIVLELIDQNITLSNEHKSETSDVFLSPKKLLGDCSFNFLQECLFCAQKCIVSCPTKNPSQWREAYSCITTADGKVTSNEAILRHSHKRNDTWGREVASKVNLAVSDLYATDARYHRDCIPKFFTSNPSAGCYTVISDSALNELLVQILNEYGIA